jgi:hypothetical protein
VNRASANPTIGGNPMQSFFTSESRTREFREASFHALNWREPMEFKKTAALPLSEKRSGR